MSDIPHSVPSYTLWQGVSAAIKVGLKAIEEVRALSRQPGPEGPRGRDGMPGKLPAVKLWEPRIYGAGDCVVRDGGIFQAQEPTGKEWHEADWLCLVPKPQDGRSFEICDTYDSNIAYRALSVVTLNNSWFIAKRDNPGLCPGEDWKSGPVGKRGKDGLPGQRGERGLPGEAAPIFVGWRDDLGSYMATPVFSDGREGAPLNIRLYLERLLIERGL